MPDEAIITVGPDDDREEVAGQSVALVRAATQEVLIQAVSLARLAGPKTAASAFFGGTMNFLAMCYEEDQVKLLLDAAIRDLPSLMKRAEEVRLMVMVDKSNPQ